jgi:hypothetical protein
MVEIGRAGVKAGNASIEQKISTDPPLLALGGPEAMSGLSPQAPRIADMNQTAPAIPGDAATQNLRFSAKTVSVSGTGHSAPVLT